MIPKKKARPVPTSLWRSQDLPSAIGLSRSTVWRLQQLEDFPKPRQITDGCVGWIPSEVEEWLSQRPVPTKAPRKRGRHVADKSKGKVGG